MRDTESPEVDSIDASRVELTVVECFFEAAWNFSDRRGSGLVPAVSEQPLANIIDSDASGSPERVVLQGWDLTDALPRNSGNICDAFRARLACLGPEERTVVSFEDRISPRLASREDAFKGG